MLVLFGFMALDHCTVINSVRPFLFVHKEIFNSIWFFLFLNLNTFWVLRFLFLWTFTNLFLRPKKPTTAFLKFSKIWVLFLIYRFLYSDTECIYYFKKYFKPRFLILKAFCSTLNSRFGDLENWRIRFLMSRTG